MALPVCPVAPAGPAGPCGPAGPTAPSAPAGPSQEVNVKLIPTKIVRRIAEKKRNFLMRNSAEFV